MKRTFFTFLSILAAGLLLTVGTSGAQDDTLKIGVLALQGAFLDSPLDAALAMIH